MCNCNWSCVESVQGLWVSEAQALVLSAWTMVSKVLCLVTSMYLASTALVGRSPTTAPCEQRRLEGS